MYTIKYGFDIPAGKIVAIEIPIEWDLKPSEFHISEFNKP
jgi:hypothetical protein